MLGYDVQVSRLTQRLMTGHWEHGNVCLVVQKTRDLYIFFKINHVVTRIFEAKHNKSEILWFCFPMTSLEIFIIVILPAAI